MWGFLIGLYLAMIIYPLFQEWRQRRHDRKKPGENEEAFCLAPPVGRSEGSVDRRLNRHSNRPMAHPAEIGFPN